MSARGCGALAPLNAVAIQRCEWCFPPCSTCAAQRGSQAGVRFQPSSPSQAECAEALQVDGGSTVTGNETDAFDTALRLLPGARIQNFSLPLTGLLGGTGYSSSRCEAVGHLRIGQCWRFPRETSSYTSPAGLSKGGDSSVSANRIHR